LALLVLRLSETLRAYIWYSLQLGLQFERRDFD
jgi:hypothetical protein